MTYHLLLTRPRYEGIASRYIHICTKHSPTTPPSDPLNATPCSEDDLDQNMFYPIDDLPESYPPLYTLPVAQTLFELYQAALVARMSSIDPRDTWNNTIVDIYYPTKPDPRNPNNKLALITGYIFVKFADPANPISPEILQRSTSNIRYLEVFSHTAVINPALPETPSNVMDVYKPYTFKDEYVKALDSSLSEQRDKIIQQLVGKKVRIPSGICMGMTGKIKKVTYFERRPESEAIVLLKVLHDGIFAKTYLSFTLSELA